MNKTLELRPVIGLTRGLPEADMESLTIQAILTHRRLVDEADQLFQALPDECKMGKTAGGSQHLAYIDAAMQMHSQMSVVSTLIAKLGRIPKV
jgi:TraR antiactivator